MAVGFGKSRGVTILPMTETARKFVFNGIAQQRDTVSPRFTDDDVGKVIVTRFAQSEIQVVVDAELNGRDVIIFFSYEQPINERIAELRLTMQIAQRSGADRITVVTGYTPYSRGEKQDQYHGSVAFKDFADSLNYYKSCFITCDMHDPVALGFFNEPARMLSLRNILMAEARKNSDITVAIATDAGGVKRVRKWSETLFVDDGRFLSKVVVDKQRTGNDDRAMAEQCFGADVKDQNVLIIDDEAMTLGTMISATKVLKEAGANEIRAIAYHGVLAGPAIHRLVKSPITELVVTNTVPVPQQKIDTAGNKLRVIPIEGFLIEAARRWYAGESLKNMIEYAK